ncbi:MAG TPA: glycoside hydrolase family 130 protein [Caulobacterales bacterium]|nr:glycoside hydrolase family 130 protein [Caulobacterales bacterium]
MVNLHYYALRLQAEPAKVVIRPFHLAPEPHDVGQTLGRRARRIVSAVLEMSDDECKRELALVDADFTARHWQTKTVYLSRYQHIAQQMNLDRDLSDERKELIGAYFCHEYSYAAAAIMNPSVVPHVDQSGLRPGDQRFILSVRTVGEGHISSIAFREGILAADGELTLWPQPAFSIAAEATDVASSGDVTAVRSAHVPISGTVIFPFTHAQRNGLEDLRLVQFREDDGRSTYYGTYTAFSGAAIASELLATEDFNTFRLEPFRGDAAAAKGMALFPRRVNGAYAMIGRQDNESIFFLQSNDLRRWDGGDLVMKPKFSWELIQLGNCGSPVELDEGWLLITHGVGAMRKYSIGAILLDKNDPRRVLGRLPAPFLSPSTETREGYVPNVVYTCGVMKHGASLFVPFAIADSSVAFAMVDLNSLLSEMV